MEALNLNKVCNHCVANGTLRETPEPWQLKAKGHSPWPKLNQSPPKGAGKPVPRKNCRKVSKIFLKLFDDFWRFLPCAKNVQKCRKYFWHLLTIFDVFWRGPFPLAPFAVHCWEAAGLGNWPKRENSQKCLGEGAKGLLDPGSKGLRKVFCTTQNPFCTGAKAVLGGAKDFSETFAPWVQKTFCTLP